MYALDATLEIVLRLAEDLGPNDTAHLEAFFLEALCDARGPAQRELVVGGSKAALMHASKMIVETLDADYGRVIGAPTTHNFGTGPHWLVFTLEREERTARAVFDPTDIGYEEEAARS